MKKNRLSAPLLFLFPLACALCGAATPAGEVSRTPPAIYAEKLEPRLTPVGEAEKLAAEIHDKDAIGIILIDERLHWVDAQGRRTMARHSAYKSLTEAAVEHNAADTFTYRKHDQKFTLVLAETIQPDGTVLPVKASAVILQTPQRQADNALFDDLAEVRVIFPNVKPGSITRTITVIEDLRTRMPGEYTQWLSWGYGWPTAVAHQTIDMPDSLSRRVRLFPVGTGVPAHTVETTDDGRVLYHWNNTLIPARKYEVRRAPSIQAGPAITLTSIASWEDIGKWYAGLVSGRDKLAPALAAEVDEWTRGLDATSSAGARAEIIRILFAKVTNDVRYTGLEFGDADYQPHDCNEVWENQYGDCKDKSNLLVAFLRHKNIPAHIALINTDHLGVIDRRAPNFRVFDHAIVAIPDESLPGGHLFCDPTISWAEPGELHNGDTDRDVFVINETAGSWARTPPQKGRSLAYDFDLQLSANGELSGWLAVTAEGYSASGWRAWTRRYDIDGLRRNFQQHIRPFYDGANVIDVIIEPAETTSGPCIAKTYFIVPGRDAETQTLSFPVADNLLPHAGNSAQRETNFPLSQGRTALTATIKLPPGAAPSKQTDPYHVATPSCTIAARWDYFPLTQTCRAKFEIDLAQPSVSATEFARFYQALQSLRAWLQQPLVLTTTPGQQSAAISDDGGAAGVPEIDFPMMPTGDGQLELADTRYPVNGNRALARAALEKTLQYFPSDKPTVFTATVNLARIDWYADENQKALDRVTPLLAGYKNDVSPGLFGWGEYIQALVLRDLKRNDESLAICERLALDTGLPPYRRSLAALQVGALIGETDPDRALSILDAVVELRSSEQAGILAAMARLRLRNGQDEKLRSQLDALVGRQPSDIQTIFAELIKSATDWTGKDAELQARLVATMDSLVPSPTPELAEPLETLRARVNTNQTALTVQARLKTMLSESTDNELRKLADPNPALKDFDDYKKEIDNAEARKDAVACAHLYLQSLVALPVDDAFTDRLVQTVLNLDWKDRRVDAKEDDPIILRVFELCKLFPHDNDAFNESFFQHAKYLQRRDKHAEAKAIYEKLTLSPETPESYRPAAYANLGACREKDGDYAGALRSYKEIENSVANNYRAADAVLRAVFINLHENRPDEALRIIKALEACSEETLKKAQGEHNIREFITLAKSGQARDFWRARDKWWPQWTAFLKKRAPASGTSDERARIIPVIPDIGKLNSSLHAHTRATPEFWDSLQTLASASRWLPSTGAYLARTAGKVAQLIPSAKSQYDSLLVKMVSVPIGEENDHRSRLFQYAYLLGQQKRHDESLDAIARFKQIRHEPDWMTFNINRIWADIALVAKKQRAEAAAALEQNLADPNAILSNERNHFVTYLANLHRSLGRTDAEAALLAREITNPWFVANAAALDTIKKRAAQLEGSTQFSAQVAAWLRDNPIPWYDYAEPASLDDPRLRNLDEVLRAPARIFNTPEIAKLSLLVAQSTSGTQERQRSAMTNAIIYMAEPLRSVENIRAVYDSIIMRDGFDDEVRRRVLQFSIWTYFWHDKKEAFRRDYERLQDKQLTPEQKKRADTYAAAMEADRTSSGELLAAIRRMAEDEIDAVGISAIKVLFNSLVNTGDLDALRALIAEIPTWRFNAESGQTGNALALDFSNYLRMLEMLQPVHEALARVVNACIKDMPAEPPSFWDDLCLSRSIPTMELGDQRAACLWSIKIGSFERTSIQFWATLLSAFKRNPEDRKIAIELLKTAIKVAPDDMTLTSILAPLTIAIDMDSEQVREAFRAAVAPYRNSTDYPKTNELLRMYDTQMALRAGEAINPLLSLAGIDDPLITVMRHYLSVQYNLQKQDQNALKQIFTQTSSGIQLSKWMLINTMRAYRLLDMKTQTEVARNAARRELYLGVVSTWAGSQADTSLALHLAETLDEPALVPDAWIDALENHCLDLRMRLFARFVQAKLKKDWASALASIDALIVDYPTYYHYYWFKAEVLWNLGRKAEAKPALETYTKHAKDEIEYPEAMRMLAELQ